jgi:ABC-2 type transport system permease protein
MNSATCDDQDMKASNPGAWLTPQQIKLDSTESKISRQLFRLVGTKDIEMDILKLSMDWAKNEVFSSKVVWLFSVIELVAAFGFSYLGKTPMAKSFVWPLLTAGLFLALVGAGLFFANNPRIDRFQQEYRLDPNAFVQSEIQRTEKSKGELALVFRIIPVIIILSAAVILVVPGAVSRAIAVTVILNAAFLMAVDSNTEARNNIYYYEISTLIK